MKKKTELRGLISILLLLIATVQICKGVIVKDFRGPQKVDNICSMTLSQLNNTSAHHISHLNTHFFYAFQQTTDVNQDPVLVRFDGTTRTCCEKAESSGDDGNALGLIWDTDRGLLFGAGSTKGNQGWFHFFYFFFVENDQSCLFIIFLYFLLFLYFLYIFIFLYLYIID